MRPLALAIAAVVLLAAPGAHAKRAPAPAPPPPPEVADTCDCDTDPTCVCDDDEPDATDDDSSPEYTLTDAMTATPQGLLMNAFEASWTPDGPLSLGAGWRVLADENVNVHHFLSLTVGAAPSDAWSLELEGTGSPTSNALHPTVRGGVDHLDHVATALLGGRLGATYAFTAGDLAFAVGAGAGLSRFFVDYTRENATAPVDGSFDQFAFDGNLACVFGDGWTALVEGEAYGYTASASALHVLPLRGAMLVVAGVASSPPLWLVGAGLTKDFGDWTLSGGYYHQAYVDVGGSELLALNGKRLLPGPWTVSGGVTVQVDDVLGWADTQVFLTAGFGWEY